MNHGHDPHDSPGTVLDQIAKVVERRALLLRHGLDALFGAQEGDHEQDQTQGGPYGHGHLPAVRDRGLRRTWLPASA